MVWMRKHGCPPGKALAGPLEDPNIDLLVFPVGLVGEGMPLNTPFDVETQEPCSACGVNVKAWFEWQGPKIIVPGLVTA